MRKISAIVAVMLTFSLPMPLWASSMGMTEHMEHKGGVAHEEVIEGVKVTFRVISMAEHMKALKMKVPTGMKDTHHIAAAFKDARSGQDLTEGEVLVKVHGPGKSEQIKDLMGMEGHFGADFDLSRKGKYGVTTKFKLQDGQVRQARFWYEVR